MAPAAGVMLSLVLLVLPVPVLVGCAGLFGGGSSPASARRVSCERACDHDYQSCSDTLGARREGLGAEAGVFGMAAACDREDHACLEQCRAAAAEARAQAKDAGPDGERHATPQDQGGTR